ncbi:acetyl esterase [Myroides marinus]|uniref:Acetyl esterase n=1 Tax=Myroides marinus TaxID=703342 RepID=A0A1H6U704_9FLAO|nr:alpha/beta hydrolase [Myroides marinus]SEI83672.1 acetyl esterase [Myroides marinus]
MNIDKELLLALMMSAWTQIPYDTLLEFNPQQIRVEEEQLMRLEGQVTIPTDLEVYNKEILTSYNTSLSLRIYKPKEIHKPLPVVLFLHGGAFIFGSPEQYDFQLFDLVREAQVIVVSVDYRLAPEYPFPAALEDSIIALQYVYKYAETLGGNKQNISVMGSSAGGTIALSLLHLNRDSDKIPITNAFILYPPTSDKLDTLSMQTYANAPMQSKHSAIYMWKHYLSGNESKWREYAIPNQMNDYEDLPPMTFILAECDPLIDEAKEYVKLVQQSAGQIEVKEIKGAVHTFDFFECAITTDFTQYKMDYFKKLYSM